MHIVINAKSLINGHKFRGVGRYTQELVDALCEYQPTHHYSVITGDDQIPRDADIYHFPFFDPFFLTLPWFGQKPLIVTVHDLIPIVYPTHFLRGVRGEMKWQLQKKLLRYRANHVITDSESSSADIRRLTGIPGERISVIPLAPRDIFRSGVNRAVSSEVQREYKLKKRFILFVGDVNWNKNVPRLIEAFGAYLKKINNQEVTLVFVGRAFVDESLVETQNLTRIIRSLELDSFIQRLGYVDDSKLKALYASADVTICPSIAEGFGFPVVEAMACGCPVISSNTSSLKEISGPAIQINPENVNNIRDAIDMVRSMTSPQRSELIQKGFDWVQTFTWKRVANATVSVYEQINRNYSGI